MRLSTAAVAVLAGASAAYAQSVNLTSIEQTAMAFLSKSCQATVVSLLTTSDLSKCLNLPALGSLLTSSNTSIIPTLDMYLSSTCSAQPCSNVTLTSAAMNVTSSCASDLASFGIANSTVYEVMGLYPLGREIACLKTVNATSPANASIPLNSSVFNATGGTFCATELLTDLSAYLGANLTANYIATAALGGSASTVQKIKSIPATALCNDCVFAAIDLIEVEYPQVGNLSLSSISSLTNSSMANSTASRNTTTLNMLLDGVCPATNYTLNSNGTLPGTIREGAVNSTFPYTLKAGNVTYTPGPGAVAAPTLNASLSTLGTQVAATATPAAGATGSSVASMKKRWLGQW